MALCHDSSLRQVPIWQPAISTNGGSSTELRRSANDFQVPLVKLDCNTLHDQIQPQHNASAAFLALHNSCHALQWPAADNHFFAGFQIRMRLDAQRVDATSQRLDFCAGKRNRFTTAADNRVDSWQLKYANSLVPMNVYKQVVRKQRPLDSYMLPILPMTQLAINGKKKLYASGRKMLSHFFFLTRACMRSKPHS